MFDLSSIYLPMASRPFLSNATYSEYAPCDVLKPFIHCYWGTAFPLSYAGEGSKPVLVIPDTCMDMIIEVNHTKNEMTGIFCSIQDKSFISTREQSHVALVSRFAVRFYFWSIHLFTDSFLHNSFNQSLELDLIFSDWKIALEPFYYIHTIQERIALVEGYLIDKLNRDKLNSNFFNTIYKLLDSAGTESIQSICAYSTISQRQLERLFLKNIGISMKKTANLVRYQNVWRDMLFCNDFHIHQAVERYGYVDQSHLLNEFKKFHGVTPKQALHIARESQ